MGTLSSELAPHALRLSARPRVYADANVPAGLVAYMRQVLEWDVLFVLEDDDLRRAADRKHYQLATQLQRTLVTLDRDYLDDRKFPPGESGGVLVLTAPEQKGLAVLLARLDKELFRRVDPPVAAAPAMAPLPLEGRKLHVHIDWAGDSIQDS